MKLGFALGGTDRGRSGISTFVREVLPGLRAGLAARGGELLAFGAREDHDAFAKQLEGVRFVETPARANAPGPSALWYLSRAGHFARSLGAEVLLLPAGNRRLTYVSPVPTVVVVHDLAQIRVEGKFDWLRMLYARQIMTRAFLRATELVAVSRATRVDLCEALRVRPERIRVVLNGVDAKRFAPLPPGAPRIVEARALHGLEGKYILYPARLEHPGKNHLRLLRAFAACEAAREHTLVLSGADFGAGERIAAETARLGLGARVKQLGYVEEKTLPALVAGADAIAMVGLYEGFGLPALEALAAGRPVFAANTGALPEVAGPLAVLCDPLSEEELSRAMGRALNDSALRARAAQEGPAWAAERSWDKTASGLLEACESAARKYGSPPAARNLQQGPVST